MIPPSKFPFPPNPPQPAARLACRLAGVAHQGVVFRVCARGHLQRDACKLEKSVRRLEETNKQTERDAAALAPGWSSRWCNEGRIPTKAGTAFSFLQNFES